MTATTRTQWEYLPLILAQSEATTARLNALGAEGWEVVKLLPLPHQEGVYQWLFKRPLPPMPEPGRAPVLETKRGG